MKKLHYLTRKELRFRAAMVLEGAGAQAGGGGFGALDYYDALSWVGQIRGGEADSVGEVGCDYDEAAGGLAGELSCSRRA